MNTHRQVLLVGENKQKCITKFIFVQHTLQFLASLNDTITIVAVNNENDTLGVLEIVSPQRTDLVLTADIPHGELNVLVFDSLDVESYGRISPSVVVFDRGSATWTHAG